MPRQIINHNPVLAASATSFALQDIGGVFLGRQSVPAGINRSVPVVGVSSKLTPRDITAAMDLVSTADKQAYLEAVEKVPHLVRTESDILRFMKVEKFNLHSAVRRQAAYWRIRRQIFGERAFLPMDQTMVSHLLCFLLSCAPSC